MIKAIAILCVLGIALFFEAESPAAEQSASLDALAKELRPSVEFHEEQVKELFMDTLPKAKVAAPVVAPAAAVVQQQVQPILPSMTIQGVIWGSSVPCVIIDNRVLKLGESINEVKITGIGKKGVEVLYSGWKYNLSLPGEGLFVNNTTGGGKQ